MHWTAVFQDKHELMKLTCVAFNRIANNMQNIETGDKMVSDLENLPNATVQKNDTFEELVNVNKTLTESICTQQDEIKTLLAIITTLSIADRGSGNGSGGGVKPPNGGATSEGGIPPWDPVGYCWSHGYKVNIGHSSAMCKNKREGHKDNAKRGSKQGGCIWNQKWKAK